MKEEKRMVRNGADLTFAMPEILKREGQFPEVEAPEKEPSPTPDIMCNVLSCPHLLIYSFAQRSRLEVVQNVRNESYVPSTEPQRMQHLQKVLLEEGNAKFRLPN